MRCASVALYTLAEEADCGGCRISLSSAPPTSLGPLSDDIARERRVIAAERPVISMVTAELRKGAELRKAARKHAAPGCYWWFTLSARRCNGRCGIIMAAGRWQ